MPQQCNWINQVGIRCGQPLGHTFGHGNGLLTTPRDVWHEFVGEVPQDEPPLKMIEKFGTVWTDKSTVKRCLWFGVTARCIYEFGHTLPHKEDITTHAH
jgi:hypothetical protein